jgi:hypothetical protein
VVAGGSGIGGIRGVVYGRLAAGVSALLKAWVALREAIEILRDLLHEATSPVKDAQRTEARRMILILGSIPVSLALFIGLMVELWAAR